MGYHYLRIVKDKKLSGSFSVQYFRGKCEKLENEYTTEKNISLFQI